MAPSSARDRLSPFEAVRLLRADVPAKFVGDAPDADDTQRFLLWWVLAGHREYPAASAQTLSEAHKCWLFEPLPGFDARGGLGLNRLLQCLYSRRPDLAMAFDFSSPLGAWDAIAWFYLTGVHELELVPFLDEQTRAALNAPAFEEPGPQPSWLMFLLWRQQPKLQEVFDLDSAKGRATYLLWFARQGAEQFRLKPLLGSASIAPLEDVANITGEFGVNLIGFAYGELGIGEDLRMAAQALQAAGVPFRVLNIHAGSTLRQADMLMEEHVVNAVAELPYAINLFCLTGFDTLRVYAEKGPQLFDGRHNIGWWPWELPVWPKRWAQAFDVIDEVWAATTFTQKMFAESTKKPVTLMPLPVSVQRLKKTSRRALGLPAKRFLFLYVFDFNSYLARKNPWAAIRAFQQAFPAEDKSVGLVLKTMNSQAGNPQWDEFTQLCAADPRITLLQTTLDRGVVLGLVDACDAYVSLHRSEGFGRTLAEAMLLGKPVVGTGFSGNADFLTTESGYPVKWKKRKVAAGEYAFVEDADAAWWAEPDIAHAASQMRDARDAAGSEWALQLPQQVDEMFSPVHVGARMAAALRERFDAIQ